MKSQILYQDETIIVANKAAGILSQPDKSGHLAIADELRQLLGLSRRDFLAPIHRLDRNTSGLLLLARTTSAAATLTEQLENREIKRCYHAIVRGDPGAQGTISAALYKNEQENRSYVSPDGLAAITHFKRIKKFATCALLELTLETGRSHQIRAHLAHIGHALLGDRKYASANWAKLLARPALHAVRLEFAHPLSQEKRVYTLDYPADFQQLMQTLLKFSD